MIGPYGQGGYCNEAYVGLIVKRQTQRRDPNPQLYTCKVHINQTCDPDNYGFVKNPGQCECIGRWGSYRR